jgi:hypothetical protein
MHAPEPASLLPPPPSVTVEVPVAPALEVEEVAPPVVVPLLVTPFVDVPVCVVVPVPLVALVSVTRLLDPVPLTVLLLPVGTPEGLVDPALHATSTRAIQGAPRVRRACFMRVVTVLRLAMGRPFPPAANAHTTMAEHGPELPHNPPIRAATT